MSKKKADKQASPNNYTAHPSKKITIPKGQRAKVAAQLLIKPTFVSEMVGGAGGNNTYQHIRYLRAIGVDVAMYWDADTGCHRYHITDAKSRALVGDALSRIGGKP